jgi:hypothetical protein
LAIFLYVPSKDEIQQRRADKKALEQYQLQIEKVDDGETLVRIMTKNVTHLNQVMSKKNV